MKVKSNVFGRNAKMALAAFTVVCGTFAFTSCYQTGPDIKPEPTPTPEPAKYYIVGSVTDAVSGAGITNYEVTSTAGTATKSGSAFQIAASGAGTYTVSIDADGYVDVEKTIIVVAASDGQISTSNADFALFSINYLPSGEVKHEGEATPTELTTMATALGIEVVDGVLRSVESGDHEANGGSKAEVSIDSYTGFITPGEATVTRALSDKEYIERAQQALEYRLGNQSKGTAIADFGKSPIEVTFNIPDLHDGYAMSGYKVWHFYALNKYSVAFDDDMDGTPEATVVLFTMDETHWFAFPVYEDHHTGDTHDAHDDGHGGSNGAGGGAGDGSVGL
ncbi:MAG: carboxypeptidase-like regulatory domain-containing protein [Prevotellaceae bacterium]|jgi:hypothetical protein|nr:carboxypeptidase-like regulatory domain-containing protein [Prevotellaceae bacterium]